MAGRSFEDLEVWKRGCQLAVCVYTILRDVSDYGLRDQMQRAAMIGGWSVERQRASDASKWNSGGSLTLDRRPPCEGNSQSATRTPEEPSDIAAKVELIDNDDMLAIVEETKQLAKMIQALINKLDS